MIDMVDKMSNEVAVVTLKHIKYNIEKAREKDDSIDVFGCDRKALDMAIKALEATSCIKEKCAYCPHCDNCDVDDETLEIKALEQQPNEDCISREEAIKQCGFGMTNLLIADCLRRLPSVTPKTEWIPVSERLPEEDGFYLATCDGEICGEDEPIVSMAEFENGKWADDEDDYQCVLAWMPLPESYQGESEG